MVRRENKLESETIVLTTGQTAAEFPHTESCCWRALCCDSAAAVLSIHLVDNRLCISEIRDLDIQYIDVVRTARSV